MRIAIFNWRDIINPKSGGAEILTHEMAKRWVKFGHEVIQFSAGFKKSKKEEIIDGVKIIRRGSWWNVHALAFFYYLKNTSDIDIVIDEVHWFPFFSILYTRRKTVLLACEVANGLFFKLLPYPIALFCRIIEKIYFYFYKNAPTLAISESTKKDLIDEGFIEKNITVLPMGIKVPKNFHAFKKEKIPTLIYVGRINKLKGIADAIDAFAVLKKQIPKRKLWVVGRGDESYLHKMKNKINSLGIGSEVIFFGFVSEGKKFELMSRAHILLAPSIKEGWGLIVSEAGFCKTPAIAYDVSGLQDVVRNNVSGLIVGKNHHEMARAIKKLLSDRDLYERLKRGAIHLAKTQNFDKTAKVGLGVLEKLTYLHR